MCSPSDGRAECSEDEAVDIMRGGGGAAALLTGR